MQHVAIRSERALVPSQAGSQWEDAGLFVVAVGSDVYFYRSSEEGEAIGGKKGSGGFSLAAVVKDVLSPTSLRTRGAAGQRKIHVHGLVPWRNLLFVYGGSKLIVINHLLETTRIPCDVGVALKGEWIVHVSLAPCKSTDQAEDFQTRLSILTAGSRLLTFQMEYAPYGDERQRKVAICDFLLVKEEEASPNTDDQSPGLRDGAAAALRPRRQTLGTHPNAAILDVRAVSWDSERNQEVVVLSASDDRTVRIWCRAGMSLEGTLEGHGGKVTCVDALPFRVKGGHYALLVLSASEDRTVRLWLHLHAPGNSSSPALKPVCLQTFEANGALRWCSFGLLGKLENVLWKSDDDEDAAVTRTDRTSLKVWAGGDGGVVVFPVDASTIRRGLRTWGAEMQMGTIISDEEQRNEQLDVASLEEEILLPVGGGEVHIRDLCRVRYTPSAVAGDPPLQNQKRVSLFVAPSRAKAEGSQEVRFMSFSVENERLAVSSGGVLERRVEIPNGMEILVLCDATAATSWREEGDSGVGSALPCFWGGTACGSLVFGFVNPAGEERGMCERVAEPQVGQGASAQRVVLLKLVKQTRERSVLAGNQQCHQAAQLRKIEDHKVHNVAHVYHFSDATSRVAGFKAGSFVLAAEFGAKPLLKSCIGGADRPLEIQDDFLVYGKRGQRKWRGEEKMMSSVVVVQKMPRADDHSSEVAGNTKEELLDLGGTDGNEVLAVALGMSVSTKADNGEPLSLAFYGGEGNELIVHGAVADRPSFQRVYRDASAVKSIFYEETLNVLLVVNAHGHVLVFDASGPHFPLQASLQNSIADEGERLVAIAAAPLVTCSALDQPQVRHALSKNAQRILFWVACTAGGGLETGHYVHNVEVEDDSISMRDDVGVNGPRSLTGLSKTPGPPVSLGPGGFGTSVAVVSTLPLTHLVAVGSTSGLIHLYRHEAGFTVTLHRFGVSLPLLGAGGPYSKDTGRFRRTDNGEACVPGEVNSICAVGDSKDTTARAAAKMNAVCYDPARKLLLAAAWDQTIRAFRIEEEQDGESLEPKIPRGRVAQQVGVGYTSVSELQSMAVDPGGSGKVIVGGRGLEWFSIDEVCDGGSSHANRTTLQKRA
eukprot:g2488.t1